MSRIKYLKVTCLKEKQTEGAPNWFGRVTIGKEYFTLSGMSIFSLKVTYISMKKVILIRKKHYSDERSELSFPIAIPLIRHLGS